MSDWNDSIIAEFRENEGRVEAFAPAHLLLLHTVGARTGAARVSPMMYFPDEGRRIVVASKGGAPENPAWFHNLLAHPEVHVEASIDGGIEEYDATAVPLSDEERAQWWPRITQLAPGFGDYEKRTSRVIPLVAVTPR